MDVSPHHPRPLSVTSLLVTLESGSPGPERLAGGWLGQVVAAKEEQAGFPHFPSRGATLQSPGVPSEGGMGSLSRHMSAQRGGRPQNFSSSSFKHKFRIQEVHMSSQSSSPTWKRTDSHGVHTS